MLRTCMLTSIKVEGPAQKICLYCMYVDESHMHLHYVVCYTVNSIKCLSARKVLFLTVYVCLRKNHVLCTRKRRCQCNSASCVKIKLCLFSEQAKLYSNRSTISVALSSRIGSSIPAHPCLKIKCVMGSCLSWENIWGQNWVPEGASWHLPNQTEWKLIQTYGSVDRRHIPEDNGHMFQCLFQLIRLK
jgi:hypothetical protein